MYKSKEKQREAVRKAVQKHREGITSPNVPVPGITEQGITKPGGITYPDIIDKLTDPVWRPRLEKICNAFQASHHPDYIQMCWLGDLNLSTVCDLVECTR